MAVIINNLKHFSICKSGSSGTTDLNIFDACLHQAGISNVNLVKISSILPVGLSRKDIFQFEFGSFLPIAYTFLLSSGSDEIISSAVAIAFPKDNKFPGLIMEYSCSKNETYTQDIVKNMAIESMKLRNWEIDDILVESVQLYVDHKCGTFAGVILF